MAIFDGTFPALQNTTVSTTGGTQVFAVTGSNVAHGSPSASFTWDFTVSASSNNLTVLNEGPNPVYLGTFSGVTSTTGVQLNQGEQLTLQGANRVLYGAVASTQTATVVVGLATNPSVV